MGFSMRYLNNCTTDACDGIGFSHINTAKQGDIIRFTLPRSVMYDDKDCAIPLRNLEVALIADYQECNPPMRFRENVHVASVGHIKKWGVECGSTISIGVHGFSVGSQFGISGLGTYYIDSQREASRFAFYDWLLEKPQVISVRENNGTYNIRTTLDCGTDVSTGLGVVRSKNTNNPILQLTPIGDYHLNTSTFVISPDIKTGNKYHIGTLTHIAKATDTPSTIAKGLGLDTNGVLVTQSLSEPIYYTENGNYLVTNTNIPSFLVSYIGTSANRDLYQPIISNDIIGNVFEYFDGVQTRQVKKSFADTTQSLIQSIGNPISVPVGTNINQRAYAGAYITTPKSPLLFLTVKTDV
jgi:hypothetical protein